MTKMKRSSQARRGVAAVEFAVLLPVLLIFLLGSWEVGRMIEVQQLLNNAVREGGRQASTGAKNTAAVKQDVVTYLTNNGISSVTTSNVTVTNLTDSTRSDPTTALQLDQIRVSVSIPFNSVRWILLNQLTNVTNLSASSDWYSMRDSTLNINTTIPLN